MSDSQQLVDRSGENNPMFGRTGGLKRASPTIRYFAFRITSLPILLHFVLPFFYIYPLVGFKGQQYNIWLQAVSLLISDRSNSTRKHGN
jgi:hypothetical protein